MQRVSGQLHAAGVQVGEVEQAVDELDQGLASLGHLLQTAALLAGQPALQHELGEAEHRVHGCADLVADIGQEVGLGPGRRFGRGSRTLQLGHACLDQVFGSAKPRGGGCQLGEPADLARQAPQRDAEHGLAQGEIGDEWPAL